jgi:hypothetical protein
MEQRIAEEIIILANLNIAVQTYMYAGLGKISAYKLMWGKPA